MDERLNEYHKEIPKILHKKHKLNPYEVFELLEKYKIVEFVHILEEEFFKQTPEFWADFFVKHN